MMLCSALCSAANKCLVKVALLSSNMQQFEKAAEIFEQVSVNWSLEWS